MKTSPEQETFDRFLQRLDTDRERAGERYETIRRKVVKFFQWRGCAFPEDHADDVMNRMIGKFTQDQEIQDPSAYCMGVARLVYLEIRRSDVRERDAIAELQHSEPAHGEDSSQDQAFICLTGCLAGLPEQNHQMILKYYEHEGGAKIEQRKRLADEFSIPLNALRIRALRLRERLEHCVRGCLKRAK
jgi:DNA-directed RNA polymerase specialized sigma24 family protein